MEADQGPRRKIHMSIYTVRIWHEEVFVSITLSLCLLHKSNNHNNSVTNFMPDSLTSARIFYYDVMLQHNRDGNKVNGILSSARCTTWVKEVIKNTWKMNGKFMENVTQPVLSKEVHVPSCNNDQCVRSSNELQWSL